MAKGKLEVGSIFAEKYRVLAPLSEGGMGALYVAENIHLQKQLALKLMHENLAEDEVLRKRFLAEARMASRIKNGHIVDVQDVGIDAASNIPWMAMELLEGKDLKKRMREGLPPFEEACTILKQIFLALAAAHAIPVVHRDLKPANIFLAKPTIGDAEFVVKVLDFGIAKEVTEAASTTNEAMGTPLWMAPEQTIPRSEIRPSADVWALGLMVFHVFTGKLFWKSANNPGAAAGELMRQVLIDPIPPASERALELGVHGRLPPGFDEWFARSVDREPRNRFQNAGQAWSVLERILKAEGMITGSGRSPWQQSRTGEDVRALAEGIMALAPTEFGGGKTSATRLEGRASPRSAPLPPGSQPSLGASGSGPHSNGFANSSGAFGASQSESARFGQGGNASGRLGLSLSQMASPATQPSVESQLSSTGVHPGVVQVLGTTNPQVAQPRGNVLAIALAAAALGGVIVIAISANRNGNGRSENQGDQQVVQPAATPTVTQVLPPPSQTAPVPNLRPTATAAIEPSSKPPPSTKGTTMHKTNPLLLDVKKGRPDLL